MNRALWVATLVVLLAVVVWFTLDRGTTTGPQSLAPPLQQPAPTDTPEPTETSVPTATLTPTPDSNGYMPAPEGIDATVVALDESPYADLLVPLQHALDNGSLAPLRDHVWFDQVTFRPIGCGACSVYLQVPDALDTAIEEASDGAAPLVLQGYFVDTYADEEAGLLSICVDLFVHRFGTTVAYPTAPPAEPDDLEIFSHPPSVAIDASIWQVCKDVDTWNWQSWYFGTYYETVSAMSLEEEPNRSEYFVLRP